MRKTKGIRTADLVEVALFIAIITLLANTPLGYIPLGAVNATTIHIPVIVAGIVMGSVTGTLLKVVMPHLNSLSGGKERGR